MKDLQFIKRNKIAVDKWDNVIERARFSLPYAYSWYLDAIAEHWDALIWKDYEAVMPLVWLRKLGLKCIYQPNYCQQLGIFSDKELPQALMSGFIEYARLNFPYIHTNLNPSVQLIATKFHFNERKNLLLKLSKSYNDIAAGYSSNHRRNISKAVKAGVKFSETTELETFQDFYIEQENEKDYFKPKHVFLFKTLSNIVHQKAAGKFFIARDKEQKLLAASLMIYHRNRIINIINCNSERGRQLGASHFLFDQIISQHIDNQLIVDFEGSSIPGVAGFYKGFGAVEEIFFNFKHTFIGNISQRFS